MLMVPHSIHRGDGMGVLFSIVFCIFKGEKATHPEKEKHIFAREG